MIQSLCNLTFHSHTFVPDLPGYPWLVLLTSLVQVGVGKWQWREHWGLSTDIAGKMALLWLGQNNGSDWHLEHPLNAKCSTTGLTFVTTSEGDRSFQVVLLTFLTDFCFFQKEGHELVFYAFSNPGLLASGRIGLNLLTCAHYEYRLVHILFSV